MLTVLREMAEAAAQASERTRTERRSWSAVIAAGWKSVERTPTLLKVLADAGVVDAGGYGLVVLVEGAANGRGGAKTVIATRFDAARSRAGRRSRRSPRKRRATSPTAPASC